MKKFFVFIWEIIKIVVISLAIIIPVRYYLIQPFFVRGASMQPNFHNGEYLVVDEISYRFEDPQRGQPIVFKYPKDPSQYYIKRIIGLPGETVEIKDKRVIIYNKQFPQGIVLDESAYLRNGQTTWGNVKMTLGPDEYFVLGDNRGASSDSRQRGSVPEKYIIGRVWIRAWPFNKAEIFSY